MWGELLRTLLGRRMLRAFLRVVSADRPALASGIAALDIDDSASGDPVDPFEVRLLPPGRRSLIDRADLRTYLRRFRGAVAVDQLRAARERAVAGTGVLQQMLDRSLGAGWDPDALDLLAAEEARALGVVAGWWGRRPRRRHA
jgi:hypothetical protein